VGAKPYTAGSMARYISGPQKNWKTWRDRILPFLFTAFFGATLESPGSPILLVGTLVAALLWGLSAFMTRLYFRKCGTLYSVTSLVRNDQPKDVASGAIGRSFSRVRNLRRLILDWEQCDPQVPLRIWKQVRPMLDEFDYALKDDDRNSGDNLLLSSLWSVGWSFGAGLHAYGTVGETTDSLVQWHAPAPHKIGKLDSEGRDQIGGEGIWAKDVLEFNRLARLLEEAPLPEPDGEAHQVLELEYTETGRFGRRTAHSRSLHRVRVEFDSAPAASEEVLVVELGRGSQTGLTQLQDLKLDAGAYGTIGQLIEEHHLQGNPWAKLVGDRPVAAVTWLSWRWDQEEFEPLDPRLFEQATMQICTHTAALLERQASSPVLLFCSIPEALQVPLGFGVEALYVRGRDVKEKEPASPDRICFALTDSSQGACRLMQARCTEIPAEKDDSAQGRQLVNLLPYPVRILAGDGEVDHQFPAAVDPVSPGVMVESLAEMELAGKPGLPLARWRRGTSPRLPEPRAGVSFIVSWTIALANPTRKDLLYPLEEVRDGAGALLGYRSLGRA
jgi:hypothetical protein